jgi:hypothetical protein
MLLIQFHADFTAAGKTQNGVIPRHASCRGISLFPDFKPREIPHSVRNDKQRDLFRSPFSLVEEIVSESYHFRLTLLQVQRVWSEEVFGSVCFRNDLLINCKSDDRLNRFSVGADAE